MDLAARKRPSDLLEYGVIATLMWRSSVSNRALGRNRNHHSAFAALQRKWLFYHASESVGVLSVGVWLDGYLLVPRWRNRRLKDAAVMTPRDLFRLDGRTAFVSGARGHLGAVMARALAGAGAHVIVNGRDDAKLAAFEAGLRAEGHSVERAAFDVADSVAVRAFFGGLKRLDILVNNAVSMQVKDFVSLQPSDFAVTYESAVSAAF